MELSPEEYGTYWRASARIAAGLLVVLGGYRLATPMISHPEPAATGFGLLFFVGLTLAGTFLATLGVARVVRAAVAAENRR